MKPSHFLLSLLGLAVLLVPGLQAYDYVHPPKEATLTPQFIASENYNDHDYSYDAQEYWHIYTNLTFKVIQLEVDDVNYYFKIDCSDNFVQVYDGTSLSAREITKICGNDRPTVKSSGPHMYVHVGSVGGSLDGIRLRYVAADPGPSTGVIVGSIIGALALIAIVVAVIWYCKKGGGASKRKKAVKPDVTSRPAVAMVPTSTITGRGYNNGHTNVNNSVNNGHTNNIFADAAMAYDNVPPTGGWEGPSPYGGFSGPSPYGGFSGGQGHNPPLPSCPPNPNGMQASAVPNAPPPAYYSLGMDGGNVGGSYPPQDPSSAAYPPSAPYPPPAPNTSYFSY